MVKYITYRKLRLYMTVLGSEWDHLKNSKLLTNDFIDDEFFGCFIEAWGRKNDKGEYDTIIGLYYREKVKYPCLMVYIFEDVKYGKTRIHSLAEKIRRKNSNGKPILDKDKGTLIGSANTSDEAKQIALEYLEN